jgi:hypothetical protein
MAFIRIISVAKDTANQTIRLLNQQRSINRAKLIPSDTDLALIAIEFADGVKADMSLANFLTQIAGSRGGQPDVDQRWYDQIQDDHFWESPTSAADGLIYPSSAWTGINSIRDRARVVRQTVPALMSAVEALLGQYQQDTFPYNGGPPLDDREEAIAALRGFHTSLGALLEAAEREDEALTGDGLLVEAVGFLRRVASAVRNDPLPFALAGVIEVTFSAMGWPGASIIAVAAMEGRRAAQSS